LRNLRNEAPQWAVLLPQLPRLMHRALSDRPAADLRATMEALLQSQRHHNRLLTGILSVLLIVLLLQIGAWLI